MNRGVKCQCGMYLLRIKTDSPWEFELYCLRCQETVAIESWAHKDPPPEFIGAEEWPPEKTIRRT